MKTLVVIDMQNDFVDGALGTKEAAAMVPHLLEKVKAFDGDLIFTKDTHPQNYAETQEGHLLPVAHCIKGTKGWELIPELATIAAERHAPIFEKPTFGSVDLVKGLKKRYDAGQLESVEFIGLCTDICVISNALLTKAEMPELPIYCDESCCAGVSVEKHQAAIEVMKSCQVIMKGDNHE